MPEVGRLEPLRDSLRATVKELIWLGVRVQPGEKNPILLFCTRRGGSTWLMEMIAANRGILPMNQPVEILTPNLTPYQYRRIPKFDLGQVIHPDPEMDEAFAGYVEDLLAGRILVNAPHRFWRKGFAWRPDRLLLKMTGSKAMMDWFDQRFEVDTVFLTRHPVPQALSCIRNGWGTSTPAYLRNERYVEEVLGGRELRDFADQRERSGSDLERFVVNWAVENHLPLQRLRERPHWLAVSYEECVTEQEATTTRLAATLGLESPAAMRATQRRESRSSSLSTEETRSAIRAGDGMHQVAGWTQTLAKQDRYAVAEILDRFGVSLYRADAPMPDWSDYRAAPTA